MTGKILNHRDAKSNRFLFVILQFFLIIWFTGIYGQNGHYERIFTTANGLPHDNILSLVSDKTGFLWIGTWDGLSRFDGYEFRNYYHDPDDPASIPYFIAYKICVDRFNNVWIYHVDNVISRYQRATDDFYPYTAGRDTILDEVSVNEIDTDNEGNLIVSGDRGLAVYDPASERFKLVPVYDSEIRPLQLFIIKSFFDNEDNIWVTTHTDLLKGRYIKTDSGRCIVISEKFKAMGDDRSSSPGSHNWFYRILTLADDSEWLLSNTGLKKIPTGDHSNRLPEEPDDAGDFYWFATDNGIRILTPGENIDIALNADETVQALYVDPYGTVWYSTVLKSGMGTGLHRFNLTPDYFKHYLPEVNGLPSVVYSIIKDRKGNLLVGTRSTEFISHIDINNKLSRLNVLSHEEALYSDHVRCMIPYKDGILIGYMKGRLDFYNEETGKITNMLFTSDTSHLKEPFGFRTLLSDSSGYLLIGTLGLYKYEPVKMPSFTSIWQSYPVRGKGIFSMKMAPDGIIWAGTGRELLKITHDLKVDTVYTIGNAEYNIEDICFDSKGKMWLALLGGGLEFFDPESGYKEFYTTADGLSNNTTYSILKDTEDNLWISTNNGISRFNTSTGKFRIFGQTDGLKIHEFNSDAAFLDTDGRMFFGGMGGVVSFHPDSIVDIESVAAKTPLIITEFRVSGLPRYFDKAIYETGYVSLLRGDDNFAITFACIDFKNPEKIQYRYRISELSSEWTESGHLHRNINFTGLSPGTYNLEIESTDIFGTWNNNLHLRVKIPPRFHETAAFTVIMLTLGLGVLIFLFVLNSRQIRIKESQKQQYLKLESIRGQMNPHFIFNSLNSINYFIANNDGLAANRYIANFSKLIRSFLNNMSQQYICLSDEIASLEDYLKLEFLRFGDKFDYNISHKQIRSPEKWEVFPGMIQPFVENAIWHGVRGLQDRKGLISVVFSEDGNITCTICDDGIGREQAEQSGNLTEHKKSRGIGLILERMNLINRLENKNYRVKIEDLYSDRMECGTKIVIDIPSRIKK